MVLIFLKTRVYDDYNGMHNVFLLLISAKGILRDKSMDDKRIYIPFVNTNKIIHLLIKIIGWNFLVWDLTITISDKSIQSF